jgi:hypothetical protein
MRHYDELARLERDGFDIIVDKTWEDLPIADLFDDTCHDIRELERKVDAGIYEWFMLRVRVLVDGHELGSHYLGGCMYENAREVLTDGVAEDCIWEALKEAKSRVWPLMRQLQAINENLEREAVCG